MALIGGLGDNGFVGAAWVFVAPAPPSAHIKTPSAGASYTLGQVVHSSFSCSEGANGPGLASCLDHGRPSGARIDTSTVGSHTFTVTASSKDGLASSKTVHYTVLLPTRVRITLAGVPRACKSSAVRLRVTLVISPRASATRRDAHGHLVVRVGTVIRLDGRRLASSARRAFTVRITRERLAVGANALSITATTGGSDVQRSRAIRRARISRCAPAPAFTS